MSKSKNLNTVVNKLQSAAGRLDLPKESTTREWDFPSSIYSTQTDSIALIATGRVQARGGKKLYLER